MVKLYNDGKRITAALSGDIDHHAAREMRRELDEVIERSQPELLIIDMENVGFMDSSGIGLILGRLRAVRACGGDIIIKNARPPSSSTNGARSTAAIASAYRNALAKREILNECRLSFPSLSVNESYARAAAAAFAAQADPTVREISEIKTAVSEAVTNAIVHGYRGCVGTVELIMRQYPGGLFYICVRDKGAGIQDVEQAMTPLFTTAPEEERSGLGFSVMESFMDRVSVRSAPGKGTSVTMEKRISAHARPADPERSEKQVSLA